MAECTITSQLYHCKRCENSDTFKAYDRTKDGQYQMVLRCERCGDEEVCNISTKK